MQGKWSESKSPLPTFCDATVSSFCWQRRRPRHAFLPPSVSLRACHFLLSSVNKAQFNSDQVRVSANASSRAQNGRIASRSFSNELYPIFRSTSESHKPITDHCSHVNGRARRVRSSMTNILMTSYRNNSRISSSLTFKRNYLSP